MGLPTEIALIGLVVSVLMALLGYLFKIDRDQMIERITQLECRLNEHHEKVHISLERSLGSIEGQLKRVTGNED